VDFGRSLGETDGGGGGGGGVLPVRNFGAGEVGRLGGCAGGAFCDGPLDPNAPMILSGAPLGTSRFRGLGERGESTRNDGGERGGAKVLYTETGRCRDEFCPRYWSSCFEAVPPCKGEDPSSEAYDEVRAVDAAKHSGVKGSAPAREGLGGANCSGAVGVVAGGLLVASCSNRERRDDTEAYGP